ncbi:MAG: nucleotidyltransferase domain-containing protein, partial [Myxococcales bacterium]|nr:nucleotidyltransferase domain-containing protein [Myxococcales bacterium]
MPNPDLEPDLEHGRRFITHNTPAGRVIQCGVTGSHFYGFPSPDSDLDLKGIHVAPTESVLGLEQPPETFDRLEVFDGLECDYTVSPRRMTWLCELSEPSYRWGMANRWSKQAWDEKHARAVLERWQRSGLSLREFARRQGISGAKLQYWKGRLLGAQARRRP